MGTLKKISLIFVLMLAVPTSAFIHNQPRTDGQKPVLSASQELQEIIDSEKAIHTSNFLPENFSLIYQAQTQDAFSENISLADQMYHNRPQTGYQRMVASAMRFDKLADSQISLGHSEDNQIVHKLRFNFTPTKTEAKIKYTGLLSAQFTYDVFDQDLKFEVEKTLGKSTSVVVNHSDISGITTDQVGFRLNW